ncbi:Uncharacterised protein [Mycoplasmopsis maculosa]|uniref:Uncharacterized protein n=1 Tax=Mycoplasmopsis maculosa TaxID=114885 RepID=A0A449B4B1_9BACT|nr:Uncharacterised protein [Mycoplasmopsis maculosa]
MKIENLKMDDFKSKFVLLNFNDDVNPSLPFYVIEYTKYLFDNSSLPFFKK